MDAHGRSQDSSTDEIVEEIESIVTFHQPSPDRTVFTERDNTDGWIATDLAVELKR